jgi:6-pyruvoyltetrahydropterin/6-carboxytetrahydropterin synthase
MFEISVKSSFSGAHRLKGYKGKCESLHGHNWDVEAFIGTKKLDAGGLSMDFKDLKKKLNEALETLDHRDLNGIAFFKRSNPSAENIAKYIYDYLKKALKGSPRKVSLRKVSVWETKESRATYFE